MAWIVGGVIVVGLGAACVAFGPAAVLTAVLLSWA